MTNDTVTVTIPAHLLGSVVSALRRAAFRLAEEGKRTDRRPSERAMALAESKWLTAAVRVIEEARRTQQ